MTASVRTILGVVALAVVGAAIVGGFFLVGSPGEARAYRLDTRRVEDLRSASSAVDLHWNRSKALPASIDEAIRTRGGSDPLRDPGTGDSYGYRVVDETHYELCAVFERASQEPPSYGDPIWAHASGRQCFTLQAKEFKR